MNYTSTILQRQCSDWVRAKFPDTATDMFARLAKLTEEFGEFARAIIGEREGRSGRGDPVIEAAQMVLVLLSIFGEHFPFADLYAEVQAEIARLTK